MGGCVRAVLMALAAVEKPVPGIFLGLDFFFGGFYADKKLPGHFPGASFLKITLSQTSCEFYQTIHGPLQSS